MLKGKLIKLGVIVIVLVVVFWIGLNWETFINLTGFAQGLKGHPKMDSILDQLVTVYNEKGISEAVTFARQHDIKVKDDKVRVIVEVKPGKAEEVIAIVKALGGEVEISYKDLVQALIPIPQLKKLADEGSVKLVRLPFEPVPLSPRC